VIVVLPRSTADRTRTVIIWKDFKKVITIEGHQQAVWAVKFVGEDRVLTGRHTFVILHSVNTDHTKHRPTRPSRSIKSTYPTEARYLCRHIQDILIAFVA
jgi:hypothetical protein